MYLNQMSVFNLKLEARLVAALIFCCLVSPTVSCVAQVDNAAPANSKPAAGGAKDDEKSALPPLPADAHVQQSIQLDGKTLHYTVTVGALPVRDKDGKVAGEVVMTAYTVEG